MNDLSSQKFHLHVWMYREKHTLSLSETAKFSLKLLSFPIWLPTFYLWWYFLCCRYSCDSSDSQQDRFLDLCNSHQSLTKIFHRTISSNLFKMIHNWSLERSRLKYQIKGEIYERLFQSDLWSSYTIQIWNLSTLLQHSIPDSGRFSPVKHLSHQYGTHSGS